MIQFMTFISPSCWRSRKTFQIPVTFSPSPKGHKELPGTENFAQQIKWATLKTPSDIPLYLLVNRDPYFMVYNHPYITG